MHHRNDDAGHIATMMRATSPMTRKEIVAAAKVDVSTLKRFLQAAIDQGVIFSPGLGAADGTGRRPELFQLETTPFEHEHIDAERARREFRQHVQRLRSEGLSLSQIEARLSSGKGSAGRALEVVDRA